MTAASRTVDLVILALAIARITRLITTDTVMNQLREKVWRRFGDPGSSRLGYLITCDWCTSVYVATAATAMYWVFPDQTMVACTALALSMAAGFVSSRSI